MEIKSHYFKVPFLDRKKQDEPENDLHICGVIDCSGSMQPWWEWLADFWNECIPKTNLFTLTFDNRVKVVPDNVLNKKITFHGGGGTSIPEAFLELEKHLSSLPDHIQNITVLFVSDGQDSKVGTLEARMKTLKGNVQAQNINFICLGIQSAFPTFLSMRLRELYHQGDDAIPALYLIEFASEKAFFNQFESMRKYFYSASSVRLDPPVQIYPWDETIAEEVYEGSWVITKNDKVIVQETKEVIEVAKLPPVSLADISDIIRGWLQCLQLDAMRVPEEARDNAKIAWAEVQKMITEENQKIGIDVLTVTDTSLLLPEDSFSIRARKNYIYRNADKLLWYTRELQQIVEGKQLVKGSQSDFDVAKMMNLGTIAGKYQQKLLALKDSFKPSEFQSMLDQFKEVYSKTDFMHKKFDLSERPSAVDKFRDHLTQPDFLKGLDFIKNPFDLAEVFPLIGEGIRVKRFQDTDKNLWKVQVAYIYPKEGTLPVEYSYIYKNNYLYDFETPEKTKESINIALPLVSEEDRDMKGILRTKLVRYLISIMWTHQVEKLEHESLWSMYASTIAYLYTKEKSEWRSNLLKKCFHTLFFFLSEEPEFQILNEKLINKPISFFAETPLKVESDTRSLMIPYLVLFYNAYQKKVPVELTVNLHKCLVVQLMRKIIAKFKYTGIVKAQLNKDERENIIARLKKSIISEFSLGTFRKNFKSHLKQASIKDSSKAAFKEVKLVAQTLNTDAFFLTIKQLQGIFTDVNPEGKPLEPKTFFFLAYHVEKGKDDLGFLFEKEPKYEIEEIREFLFNKVKEEKKEDKDKDEKIQTSDFIKDAEDFFVENFKKTHFQLKMMTKDQLKTECEKRQIDCDTLTYNPSTMLIANACIAENCPYYLKPVIGLKKHLDSFSCFPIGFHLFIRDNLNNQPDIIMVKAQQMWKDFPSQYQVSEEEAMKKIVETQNALLGKGVEKK